MGTGYKGQAEETPGCGYSVGDEITPEDLGITGLPEGASGIVTSCTGSGEILLPPERFCEVERDGGICGKPARFQAVFTWHLRESRHLWACEQHLQEEREYIASIPTRPATEEEIRDAEGDDYAVPSARRKIRSRSR